MENNKKSILNARRFLVALFLCISSSLVYAAPDINIGSVSGLPGAVVNIPVTITNDGSASALQLDIQYNATQLTTGSPVAGNAINGQSVGSSTPSTGLLRIVIIPSQTNTLIGTGTLVTIPFTINATATSSQSLTISGVVVSNASAVAVTSTSTGGSQGTITLPDAQAPVITPPADITKEASNTQTPVTLGTATVTDNVDSALTASADNNGPFPLGVTTITWSATDTAGNTGTATQNVTIQDTTLPVITTPADLTRTTTNNTAITVALGSATATDIFTPVTVINDAPATFPVGTTVVTWTATDANGNAATAVQRITVVNNAAPVITTPANQSSIESAVSSLAISATDSDALTYSATGLPTGLTINTSTGLISGQHANGSAASYNVNVSVTDGTTSVNTSFVWTVTANQAPLIVPPAAITTEATAVLTPVSLGVATATDDVDGVLIPIASITGPFAIGANTVTWSATDSGGLTTTIVQTVTIVDTTAPVIAAPTNVTASTTGTTPVAVTLGQPTVTDIFAVTISNDAPALFPVGTTAVTWTATDANNNSATAVQQVTVNANTATVYEYSLLNPSLSTGSAQVMSLTNNNTIQVGNTTLTLNQYQRGTIPASDMQQGATMTGTGAFDVSSSINATDMPVPKQFEGTQFVIPHYRNSHTYYLLSTTGNATAQIKTGTNTSSVLLPQGQVVTYNAGASNSISGTITSDLSIRVMHRANNGGFIDVNPVPPAALEVWGIRSNNITIGALNDGTNITITSQSGATTTIVLNAGGRYIVTTGSNGNQGTGDAFRISADQPIAAVQTADNDGYDQSAFMRTQDLGTRFGIPTNTQYIAVVCPTLATTVALYNSQGTVINQQTCSGTVHGKAYFGLTTSGANIAGGSYLVSDQPIAVMIEDSAMDEERNLLGYNTLTTPNNNPVAQNDSANVTADTMVIISVLANDTDANGDALTVSNVTQGANGGVIINADNTVTYMPNSGYTGNDSFTYTITDGRSGNATATVNVTIAAAINNVPQLTNPGAINLVEGNTVNLLITATDADGDTLTYSATGLPPGTSIDVNTGLITGLLPTGSAGSYTVNITVSDTQDTAMTSFVWTVIAPSGMAYEYSVLNPSLSTGSAQVMSLTNNNTIQVGNTTLTLNQYQRGTIPASDMQQGATITGTGAFDMGSSIDATDMPVPKQFEGTQFVIPHYRNSHTYYLLSTTGNATAQIKAGSINTSVSLPQGQVITFNAGSNNTISGIITSDLPIRVMHRANNGSFIDVNPVPPAALEVWGIRSNNITIGALNDGTNITITSHKGVTTSIVLNAGGRFIVSTGLKGSQGTGDAFRISADQPIAAVQTADNDGYDQSAFMRTQDLGTRFGIPTNAQYISIACPTLATTVTLYDSQGAVINQQTCNGSVHGAAYVGAITSGVNIAGGSYLVSDHPIFVMYEDSAREEERNLLGVN